MAGFDLKYRPQTVSDLDLTPLKEGLSKVLKSGKIPHAFLFTGPRGTGKTSAARIVAKSVNCASKKGFEPCNKCEQCRTITAGSNLDVLEIDAASSRGIDDIRDLREKIRLAPSFSSYKVYIIDEVHMLTLEAFNALLKTLEEPPEHAIFILCTTNPEKLPDTIISRCMRFNFRRASQAEIMAKLEKIARSEKIKIDEAALAEISRSVKGSFRDANRILEQASLAGGKVTRDEIKMILDQALGLEPEKLLSFLIQKDAKRAIEEINQVVEKGGNLQVYTEELLELLRRALLVKIGVTTQDELPSFDFALPEISQINKLVSLFSRAAREAKGSLIPQLPLEVATAEYCFSKDKTKTTPVQEEKGSGMSVKDPSPQPEPSKPQAISVKTLRKGKVTLGEIQNRWQEVLLAVRPRNHSVEALLRATRPIRLQEESLVIEVFYEFHKDRLEEEKSRRIVEEVVREVFGSPLFLKCILGEKQVKKSEVTEEIEGVRVVAPNPDPGDNGETADEDIVAIAEEIFNGGRE